MTRRLRGAVLALLVAACTPTGPAQAPGPVVPADRPLGEFEDDYGALYLISTTTWTQLPHGRFNITRWVPAAHHLVARNDSSNRYAPGLWTRIDWVRLDGMPPWEWAFCLSAYEAPTADSAEATRIADTAHPRTGCNGHPFSRLKPAKTVHDLVAERCHQLYLAAGSDGPKLLQVDGVIVDSTTTPPTRCGQVRSAHPAIKSSE